MQKNILLAVSAASLVLNAQAADFTDNARVISATPIMEKVYEPRQECVAEPQSRHAPQAERSVIAPIIGGVAGALLGSTVGRGSGRDAATAAGAIAGAIVGDRVANPDSERSMAGSVVGGAAGGLLGAQVGRGNGRTAAAAAGAIAGSVAGDRIDNRQAVVAQPAQRCHTVETVREIIRGYNVVYRYNGRDISTTMPYDPGPTVRVGITALGGAGVAAAPPLPAAMPGEARAAPSSGFRQPQAYSYRY